MSEPYSVTVVNEDIKLPSLEVVPAALVQRHADLMAAMTMVQITDQASADHANDVSLRVFALNKEILAHGEKLKKPINAFKAALIDCLETATKPLLEARSSLTGKIVAWNRKQDQIKADAKAAYDAEVKAAQDKAEAEQRRLQAIANAKHAQEVEAANRQRDALLADEKRRQAELAEIMGIEPIEVDVPQVKVAAAPIVKVAAEIPMAPAVLSQPAKLSAIVTRQVPTLVITDARAIAQTYQVGAEILVGIDRAAVKRVLDAGLVVPGAHIEMVEQNAQRSTRG